MPEAFDVPQDLAELSEEDLDALEQAGMERIDAMLAEDNPDLAEMEQVATAIEAVRAEKASRMSSAEERQTTIEAIRNRVRPPEPEPEPEPVVAEVVAEVVPDSEVELVPAGATAQQRYANLSVLRKTAAPPPPEPEQEPVVIIASADVPGFSAGQHMDRLALATALHNRARSLDDGSKAIVASIEVPFTDEFWMTGDPAHDSDLIGRITNPALLASGQGWCAPLETLYGFFDISAADGLISLPTAGVRRGGVTYPKSPSLADSDPATAGNQGWGPFFQWNEAADKAGHTANTNSPTKPCMRIPCPTWVSAVLAADGLCITHGNLMDRAFPEQTTHFVSLVQKAHAHYMSWKKMKAMQTLSNAVDLSAVTPSDAVGNLANALGLIVEWYRTKYRMSLNAPLEAVFPSYVKEALRADLAMRAGVAAWNVSDGEVSQIFSSRNVRPQWVQDYPDAGGAGIPVTATASMNPATTTTVGAETSVAVSFPFNAVPSWPATTEFMLYPAGQFVAFTGGTLDLGVQRDSVLNATNDFTLAWSEEFWTLGMPGHESLKVKVALQIDGVTGCCPAA